MKQTAVEWLIEQWPILESQIPKRILDQAKAMEKENIYKCASFWRGKDEQLQKPIFEQYYNETFKSEQDETDSSRMAT